MSKSDKVKKYTNSELAEAHIFPANLELADEEKDKRFWEARMEKFNGRIHEEMLFSNILRLKFQMEDYLNDDHYNKDITFGYFLRLYINNLGKRNKEFAEEIDIKPAELSQLINNHRNPNNEILVRLEIHSNNNIPAILWYRLVEKGKQYDLMSNAKIRKEEGKHVTKRLTFTFRRA